ncbi:MAG: histidine phosphatase family protein [Ignavibacteria bacterium]|nr:histidine phosphatase family protein [Ignavibacteria bacterium]
MEIYIIRHGVAAELDNEIVEEGYRYLTIHGRNHCRIVAMKLQDLKVSFDMMLSSPLVRSVQTAEVFASVLDYSGEIKTVIELMGGSPFSRFLSLLKRYSYHNKIALFGHAPDVNIYSQALIKSDTNPVQLNFKNCSVCKIEFDPVKETGKFIWFLDSENMKLTER